MKNITHTPGSTKLISATIFILLLASKAPRIFTKKSMRGCKHQQAVNSNKKPANVTVNNEPDALTGAAEELLLI